MRQPWRRRSGNPHDTVARTIVADDRSKDTSGRRHIRGIDSDRSADDNWSGSVPDRLECYPSTGTPVCGTYEDELRADIDKAAMKMIEFTIVLVELNTKHPIPAEVEW
jgi:predicted RNase H-like HicB family nuclease